MHYQEGTYTDKSNLLSKFRTFITGIGWTELQYVAGEFLAVKSNGESGNEENIITGINIEAPSYWVISYITFTDRDTYTGRELGVFWVESVDSPYWFFADLDHFVIVTKYSPNWLYTFHYAGLLKRYYTKAEWSRPFCVMGSHLYLHYYHTSLGWIDYTRNNLRHVDIDNSQPNSRNGSYILVPVTIYDKANKLMPGEMIGMYHIATEGAEDEGTITINGTEYKTFKQYDGANYWSYAFLKS